MYAHCRSFYTGTLTVVPLRTRSCAQRQGYERPARESAFYVGRLHAWKAREEPGIEIWARYFRVSRAEWSQLPYYRNSGHKVKIQLAAVAARASKRASKRTSKRASKQATSRCTKKEIRLRPRPHDSRSSACMRSICARDLAASGCKPSCTHPGVCVRAHLPRGGTANGARSPRLWVIRRLTDREKAVVKEPAVRYNGLPLLGSSADLPRRFHVEVSFLLCPAHLHTFRVQQDSVTAMDLSRNCSGPKFGD